MNSWLARSPVTPEARSATSLLSAPSPIQSIHRSVSGCIFFPLRSLAVGGYLHPGDSRQPACRACIEETSVTGRCGRNRHGVQFKWLLNQRTATAMLGQREILLEFSHHTALTADLFLWDIYGPYCFHAFLCRAVQSSDVALKIIYCGVCYADVVWTRNMHHDSKYPVVPGHEIAGVVTQVGADVKGFKVGDHVGVGTYVNSCRDCEHCNSSLENHCPKGVYTFNGIDTDGTVTKGGYSTHIVVHERYCFQIPDGYPLAKAAPLLCAGITVYTPMMRHNMNQPGKSLGVIGLGGLGHMAVKFGKAFGLKVTVLSTSESKRHEAISLLGTDNFVISSDTQQMESLKNSLHFIVDTASGDHPFDPYLSLLKVGGVMAIVGFPSEIKMHPASLNLGARTLSGSVTGGTKDIQEMVNFCAANKIYPEIEIIKIDYINEALTRLVNRDVKYRFVINIENSFE